MAKNTYTDYEREQAIAAWVAEGSYAKASDITGIPATTIRTWHDTKPEWWSQIEGRERDRFEKEQRSLLTKIREKSLVELSERLQHGDERVSTKGEKIRVKVSARDVATIYGICTDKMRVLQGLPTSIPAKPVGAAGAAETVLQQIKGELKRANGKVTKH